MIHEDCSTEIKDEWDRLQKAENKILAAIDRDTDELQEIAETSPEQFDETVVTKGQKLQVRTIKNWQAEVKIGREISEFAKGPALANTIQVSERAQSEPSEAEADIRRRLVSIGYVDAPPDSGVIGAIIPAFIVRHPEFRAAVNRAQDAQAAVQVLQNFVNNKEQSIENTLAKLGRFKAKMLAL